MDKKDIKTKTIFSQNIFKDFQKFFDSRPIPDLYLKLFRSWSSDKTSTILLKYIFYLVIAKLK